LPTGFDTVSGKTMTKLQIDLQKLIPHEAIDKKIFLEIKRDFAFQILDLIQQTLNIPTDDFEWDAMKGLLDYYADVRDPKDGKVLLLAETGRRLDRYASGDKSGLSILGTVLRDLVTDTGRTKPALILLQQEGSKQLNWTGGQKFWWPILAAPSSVEPCVFATKVASK